MMMYGEETWTLKAERVRHLTTLHNRCVRTILGVTRYQQWEQRLTSKALANRFGMSQTLSWTEHCSGLDIWDVWRTRDCRSRTGAVGGAEKETVKSWCEEDMERPGVKIIIYKLLD